MPTAETINQSINLINEHKLITDCSAVLGAFPIHFAALHGNKHYFEAILDADNKSLANSLDQNGGTIFHWASLGGQKTLFPDNLHSRIVNPAQPDTFDNNILHYAVIGGNLDMINFIIENKIFKESFLNKTNKYGWNPLWTAIYTGRHQISALLIQNGASLQHDNFDYDLHYLARIVGDLANKRLLFESNVEIKYRPNFWDHPLTIKIKYNLYDIICSSDGQEKISNIYNEVATVINKNDPNINYTISSLTEIGNQISAFQQKTGFLVCNNTSSNIAFSYLSSKQTIATYNKITCDINKPMLSIPDREDGVLYICEQWPNKIELTVVSVWNYTSSLIDFMSSYMGVSRVLAIFGTAYSGIGIFRDISEGKPVKEIIANAAGNFIKGPSVIAGIAGEAVRIIILNFPDTPYIQKIIITTPLTYASYFGTKYVIENFARPLCYKSLSLFDYSNYFSTSLTKATKKIVEHRIAYDTEWIYLVQSPARCVDHSINGNQPKY